MSQPIDTSAVDPKEFAAQLANTPDEQIAAGMQSEARGLVLDEIFRRMSEHFRSGSARGVDAVVHWKILDRPDGGYDLYEVVIKDGQCTLSDTPQHEEARTTFSIGPVDFLKLVTGNANGPFLFTTGKLKIKGDLPFAAQMAGLFTIPK